MAAAAHRFGRKSSTQALWPRVGHTLIASPCGVLARGRGDNFWAAHLRNCGPVPRFHQDLLIHLQSVGWWATSAFNKHHSSILQFQSPTPLFSSEAWKVFGRAVYIFDGISAIGNGNNCDDEGEGGRKGRSKLYSEVHTKICSHRVLSVLMNES